MTAVDVAVLAAHPDDAEIGCGGTIVRLTRAGRRVAVIDCTRGESATRGTPEVRAREAIAASAVLGVSQRENLELRDGFVVADEASTRVLIGVLRRLRPTVLLAPIRIDAHPDHVAVADLASRANFLAGLRNMHAELGEPHRARAIVRYFGNDVALPSVCVDIGSVLEIKRRAVACYASQLPSAASERGHFLRGLDPLERAELRDRYFGSLCGHIAAEPFAIDGPVSLDVLRLLALDPAAS